MAGLLEQPARIGSHQFIDKLALLYHYQIAERLELGVTSKFYDQHGYHADALGMATVVLVPG
jgi:hypothetical protein